MKHIPFPRKPLAPSGLPHRQHAIDQAERVGHQSGPPTLIGVGDDVVALDPVAPSPDIAIEIAEQVRVDRGIGVDHHQGVQRVELARFSELLDQEFDRVAFTLVSGSKRDTTRVPASAATSAVRSEQLSAMTRTPNKDSG